jgi:hypothetical protein
MPPGPGPGMIMATVVDGFISGFIGRCFVLEIRTFTLEKELALN